MGWSGSNFVKMFQWANDAITFPQIRTDRHDLNDNDLANGINDCINKNGLNTPGSNLPMNSFKHTGVGNATARDQYLSMGQFQDNNGKFFTTTGTAPSFVLTAAPAITTYTEGMTFLVKFHAATVGSDQININTIGNKPLYVNGAPVSAGYFGIGEVALIYYNGTQFDCSNFKKVVTNNSILPQAFINGLILENDSGDTDHDIKVNTGICKDNTNLYALNLSAALIKEIDANWASGSASGGFPSGLTLAASTWYHFFLIGKTDGTVDAGFDTSLTATNLLLDATGFTLFRRVGSVLTDGSKNIIKFLQVGDDFWWDSPVTDLSSGNFAETDITLTVPTGVRNNSLINCSTTCSGGDIGGQLRVKVKGLTLLTSVTSSADNGSAMAGRNMFYLLTDTSANIRATGSSSGGSTTHTIVTLGWKDFRGKE